MNIENLNQAFIEIAEKKNFLSRKEGDKEGDEGSISILRDEIGSLEKKFLENYGLMMEEMLFLVYDEYCPDNEVMRLTQYFASKYQIVTTDNGQRYFDVDPDEGVEVDVDDFPGIKAKLVLMPSPLRLILQGENEQFREVVWSSERILET